MGIRNQPREGEDMIDWARVRELKSEIGEDSFDEVVELFLEEADEVVARMDVSCGAKALEADLHSLKGSALNLGFRDLATICQVGEFKAASGSVDIDLSRVRSVYATSKISFDADVSEATAA